MLGLGVLLAVGVCEGVCDGEAVRVGEAESVTVVVGVGVGERLAVEVSDVVGELLGVRVIEGDDEGEGVAEGCV